MFVQNHSLCSGCGKPTTGAGSCHGKCWRPVEDRLLIVPDTNDKTAVANAQQMTPMALCGSWAFGPRVALVANAGEKEDRHLTMPVVDWRNGR